MTAERIQPEQDFEAKALEIIEGHRTTGPGLIKEMAASLRSAFDAGAEQMRERNAKLLRVIKAAKEAAEAGFTAESRGAIFLALSDLNETGQKPSSTSAAES